jgi:MEMO1 family protein
VPVLTFRCNVKLIPIMVGQLDAEMEQKVGDALTPYFEEEDTIFCVSSNFCQWGKRYRFTYYNEKHGEIYNSIKTLDYMAFQHIEQQDYK